MTNGEKIRAMTDAEIAEFIARDVLQLEDVAFKISAEWWYWKMQQEEEA